MRIRKPRLAAMLLIGFIVTLFAVSRPRADVGNCNGVNLTLPFTDIAGNTFFCQIAEAYFSGLTSGTSPTTYSPASPVPREQMAAFVTRTLDQSLRRGSRRAALKEFWTPKGSFSVPLTSVGSWPSGLACDGADVWVANRSSSTVSRVRTSDGKLLETWTGAEDASRVLVARGRIYVLGYFDGFARLYRIDPTQTAGLVSTVNVSIGTYPRDIAFDGERIWITSDDGIYILSFGLLCSPCVTPVVTNVSAPIGLVYDGSNMWVTDSTEGKLKKLDSDGNVTQAVPINIGPSYPVFDGMNIWAPSVGNSVSVVRASSGALVATLTGNGLSFPREAAFDGERILITNPPPLNNGNTVSLWRATDLSPLGSVQVSFGPDDISGVCSDGLNFWISLRLTDKLARF